ncbi:MAG: hypothetical protein ABH851_02895 [Methanobacteriota archaeon]
MVEHLEQTLADEIEKKDIGYINYVLIAVIILGLISGAYTFFFSKENFTFTLLVFTGLVLGVITAYYYYESFSSEDKRLILNPDENILIESSNPQTYISVPSAKVGFLTNTPPLKVNLFLTDKGIVIEPVDVQEFDDEGKLYYLHIYHHDIMAMKPESNFMSDYIRLKYKGPNMEDQEILIFAGEDTHKWVDELTTILGVEAI